MISKSNQNHHLNIKMQPFQFAASEFAVPKLPADKRHFSYDGCWPPMCMVGNQHSNWLPRNCRPIQKLGLLNEVEYNGSESNVSSQRFFGPVLQFPSLEHRANRDIVLAAVEWIYELGVESCVPEFAIRFWTISTNTGIERGAKCTGRPTCITSRR